jgi:hypothetical protein
MVALLVMWSSWPVTSAKPIVATTVDQKDDARDGQIAALKAELEAKSKLMVGYQELLQRQSAVKHDPSAVFKTRYTEQEAAWAGIAVSELLSRLATEQMSKKESLIGNVHALQKWLATQGNVECIKEALLAGNFQGCCVELKQHAKKPSQAIGSATSEEAKKLLMTQLLGGVTLTQWLPTLPIAKFSDKNGHYGQYYLGLYFFAIGRYELTMMYLYNASWLASQAG